MSVFHTKFTLAGGLPGDNAVQIAAANPAQLSITDLYIAVAAATNAAKRVFLYESTNGVPPRSTVIANGFPVANTDPRCPFTKAAPKSYDLTKLYLAIDSTSANDTADVRIMGT